MPKPRSSSRSSTPVVANRRPIAARNTGWAQSLARVMVSSGLSPNAISVLSMLMASLGAWAMVGLDPLWGYPLAIVGVQLRLVCNLLDGMVAIEGGRKSPVGELFNEVPDRVADSVLLVALGYASGDPWMGWACALVAALTAYVRTLGGALRQQQSFRGPMAKQHRMAVLSVGLLVAFCVAYARPNLSGLAWAHATLFLSGAIILIGSVLTCWLRLQGIARRLRRQADKDAVQARVDAARPVSSTDLPQ